VSNRYGFWWTLTALLTLGVLSMLAAGLIVVLALPIALSRLVRR
jgi:hypothetical protein